MKVNNNNSNITFNGFFNSKILKKGLEYAANNGAMFGATTMLVCASTIRPLAIMFTPKTEKENRKLASAKSIASGISQYLLTFAIATPIAKAIDKIDKNPEKYLSKETIQNYSKNIKDINKSKMYQFSTQLFKLGAGTIAALPKALMTALALPFIMQTVFNNSKEKKQNNQSNENNAINFKAKNNELITSKIVKVLDNKNFQKFSNEHKNSNFALHISSINDIFTTGLFALFTNNSNKIENDRKKTLIYNASISTALSISLSYILDRLTKKPTDWFINKLNKVNKNDSKLEKYIEGVKVAKPILLLALVYYTTIPLISTYLAERIEPKK